MKRALSLIVCGLLLLAWTGSHLGSYAWAESTDSSEQKAYCNTTMEKEFADNRIMIVLNNEASLQYLQTGAFDFSEVKPVSIQRFTESRGKEVKAMVAEQDNASFAQRILGSRANAAEISGYREVLCIELPEHSKENVLETIALLEKREDVLYAGPDYVIRISSDCEERSDVAISRYHPSNRNAGANITLGNRQRNIYYIFLKNVCYNGSKILLHK